MKGKAHVLKGDRRQNQQQSDDALRLLWAKCLEGFWERRAEGESLGHISDEIKDIRTRKNLLYPDQPGPRKMKISDRSIRRAIQSVFDEELADQEARDEALFEEALAAQEASEGRDPSFR